MTMFLVAGLILLVLVASVVISSISHKREQQAAENRQRAAEFRARIQETQDLMEGLQNAGLDASVRGVLMWRIAESLAGLKACEPDSPNVDASLNFAKEQAAVLRKQAGTASPLVLPDNEQLLFAILKRLRRLLQLYASLAQLGKIDAGEYALNFPRLQHLVLRFEVEGYMKLGAIALNMHQHGTARTYLDFAHNKLISSAVTDEYTQQQLTLLQELIDRLEIPIDSHNVPGSPSDATGEASKESEQDMFQKKKW
ncbi:MAG: hypothetical protein HYV16_09290 [Gammaproteobacteria bacterium]|nr:hypothetical protein [Gammaproteobacteria bacterium]